MYPQPPTLSLSSVLPEGRAGIPDYPTHLLVEETHRRPFADLRQRLGDFFIATGLKIKGHPVPDRQSASIS